MSGHGHGNYYVGTIDRPSANSHTWATLQRIYRTGSRPSCSSRRLGLCSLQRTRRDPSPVVFRVPVTTAAREARSFHLESVLRLHLLCVHDKSLKPLTVAGIAIACSLVVPAPDAAAHLLARHALPASVAIRDSGGRRFTPSTLQRYTANHFFWPGWTPCGMTTERHPLPNDATAHTLNYALGNLGGKQKSWMVDVATPALEEPAIPPPPPPVRRRGRPRKYPLYTPVPAPAPAPRKQPQPQLVHLARTPSELHVERQPPSNSTSPQLANTVTRHDSAGRGASAITLFPSPTPSVEAPNTPQGENAIPANAHFLGSTPAYTNFTPNISSETVSMNAVHGAAPHSNGPAVAVAPDTDRGGHVHGYGHERPAAFASTASQSRPQRSDISRQRSVSQLYHGSPLLEQGHSRSPTFGQPLNAQTSSSQLLQGVQTRVAQVGRNSPKDQAPFGPPRALSRGTTRNPPPQSAPSPQQADAPPGSWYTLDECLQLLNIFQDSYAVPQNHGHDGKRLAVLREATVKQDWAYLTLHQYYCMLSSMPHAVPEGLRRLPNMQTATKMIQRVLDVNNTLSPAVLNFFSNFPYPLEVIGAKWPSQFQRQAEQFLLFVTHSPDLNQMLHECKARRYPPLVRELTVDLRIASPTFQRLLFTSFLRSMWRANDRNQLQAQYEAHAIDLFHQNMADFTQREAFATNNHLHSPQHHQQAKELEVKRWAPSLKHLVDEFEVLIRSQGTPLANQYPANRPQQPQTSIYSDPQHDQAEDTQDRSFQFVHPTEMAPHSTRPTYPPPAQPPVQRTRGRGRPRSRPHPTPRVLSSQRPTQQPRVPSARSRQPVPLLPPPGWTQPQQRQPNPARFGLHNAHLRSPILQAQSSPSPLYHFVVGCTVSPTRLSDAGRAIERRTFTLSSEEMQTIPKTLPGAQGGPDIRSVNDKSKTVRLRCIKWPSTDAMPKEHIWAVTDTTWIPYSFITFNGTSLHQRKKVHNGKDLPIDLTGLLKEGENVLEIAVMAQSHETSYLNYLVAVEVLGFQTHDSIKQTCVSTKHIPAERIVDSIKRKLSGTSEDDEICIVESNLTINLFDPFSASKMCDIPVRSTACLHNDCFDLETFLQTRRRAGDSSVADQWRCPICNADARPQRLFVDGFIEDVQRKLQEQGLARTRAIIVQHDGEWKPKPEVRDPNGVSDRGASDDPDPPTPTMARTTTPAHAKVIDLSD
ncbi:Nn.00g074320.m01.CDS01 [Neocucurbitaria sp. VM-36]